MDSLQNDEEFKDQPRAVCSSGSTADSTCASHNINRLTPVHSHVYDPRNEHEFPVKQLVRTWTIRYQKSPKHAPTFHQVHFMVLLMLEGFQISQIVSPRTRMNLLLPLAASPKCAPFELVFLPCPVMLVQRNDSNQRINQRVLTGHIEDGVNIGSTYASNHPNAAAKEQHHSKTPLPMHPIVAITSIMDTPSSVGIGSGVGGDHATTTSTTTSSDLRSVQFYSIPQRRWIDKISLPSSVFGLSVWGDVLVVALETELHLFRISYNQTRSHELNRTTDRDDCYCDELDPGSPSFELFATLPCYPNIRGRPIPMDICEWGLAMCPPLPFKQERSQKKKNTTAIESKHEEDENENGKIRNSQLLHNISANVSLNVPLSRNDQDGKENTSITPFLVASEDSPDHHQFKSRTIQSFDMEGDDKLKNPNAVVPQSSQHMTSSIGSNQQVQDAWSQLALTSTNIASNATWLFRSMIANPARETLWGYASALSSRISKAKTGTVDIFDRALTHLLVAAEVERTRLIAKTRNDLSITASNNASNTASNTAAMPSAITIDSDIDIIHGDDGANTLDDEDDNKGWISNLTNRVSKIMSRATSLESDQHHGVGVGPSSSTTTTTLASTYNPSPPPQPHSTTVPIPESSSSISSSSSYITSMVSTTVSNMASSARNAALAVTSSLTTVADQAFEPSLLSVPCITDVIGQASHVAWALNHHNHLEVIGGQGHGVGKNPSHQESLTLLLTSPEERRLACARLHKNSHREGYLTIVSIQSNWNSPLFMCNDMQHPATTSLGPCVWQTYVPLAALGGSQDASSFTQQQIDEQFGLANETNSHHFIDWIQWRFNGPIPALACVIENGNHIVVFESEFKSIGNKSKSKSKSEYSNLNQSLNGVDLLTLKAILKRGRTPGQIRSIAWARGGEWLVVTSATGTVHVFQLPHGEHKHSLGTVAHVHDSVLKRVLGEKLRIVEQQIERRSDGNLNSERYCKDKDTVKATNLNSDPNYSIDMATSSSSSSSSPFISALSPRDLASSSSISPPLLYTHTNTNPNTNPKTNNPTSSLLLRYHPPQQSNLRIRFVDLLKSAKIKLYTTHKGGEIGEETNSHSQGVLPFALPITAAFIPKAFDYNVFVNEEKNENSADLDQGNSTHLSLQHIVSAIKLAPKTISLPRDDLIVLGASPRVMLVYSIEHMIGQQPIWNLQDKKIVNPKHDDNNSKHSLSCATGKPCHGRVDIHTANANVNVNLHLMLHTRWYIPPLGGKFFATVQSAIDARDGHSDTGEAMLAKKPTLELLRACEVENEAALSSSSSSMTRTKKFDSYLQFLKDNKFRTPSSVGVEPNSHNDWSSKVNLPSNTTTITHLTQIQGVQENYKPTPAEDLSLNSYIDQMIHVDQSSSTGGIHRMNVSMIPRVRFKQQQQHQNQQVRSSSIFTTYNSALLEVSKDGKDEAPEAPRVLNSLSFASLENQLAVIQEIVHLHNKMVKDEQFIMQEEERLRQSLASSSLLHEERFSLITGVKSPLGERDRVTLTPEFGDSKPPIGLPTPPIIPNYYNSSRQSSPMISPLRHANDDDHESIGSHRSADAVSMHTSSSSPPPPPPPPPPSTNGGGGRIVLGSSDPTMKLNR